MKYVQRLATLSALALVATTGFAQAPADNQPEPTILLVPVQVTDPALEAGCWAQFYTKRDFKGDVATLLGPASVESMDKGTARQLKRDIDSLVLGPKAKLTVYEHSMFKDRSVDFTPNSREGGLIKKLGFGGRIQAMKLSCV
jgi:hypothetical protein